MRQILAYCEEAEADVDFRSLFYGHVEEGAVKCVDRAAYFAMLIGMEKALRAIPLEDLEGLVGFYRGKYAFQLATEIADAKYRELNRLPEGSDDVEVYLRYYLGLKEEFALPIDCSYMRFPHSVFVDEEDIAHARGVIGERIQDEEAFCIFLTHEQKWLDALERRDDYKALVAERNAASERAVSGEDYQQIDREFKAGLLSLTRRLLARV